MTRDVLGARPAPPAVTDERRTTLFALLWGVATLFHLAGNARPAFEPLTPLHVGVQVGLGAAALATCLLPRRRGALVVLCALVVLSAWLEAPLVGNHWVLAAALSAAFLLAQALALAGAHHQAWPLFAPTGRLVVLAAYSFAAFAKLNTGFLDPVTSCAVYFQDQIVGSWGLEQLSVAGLDGPSRAVAVAAVGVELSVPLLLVLRRTRRWGVLLALAFHWSLALDLAQHFWDFSSVLVAGFLLFADDAQVSWLGRTLRAGVDATRASVRLVTATVVAAAAAAVTWSAAVTGPHVLHAVAVLLGHAAWLVLGTAVVVLVAAATWHTRAAPEPHALRVPAAVLLLVPALVAANGLTPYLELKTGFGWTMYSNLRTVAGETNHLLLPGTLPLSDAHDHLVEVVATSDPALEPLVGSQYAVVLSELQEYAARHPGASLRYVRAGRTVVADPVSEDPALQDGGGVLSHRLRSYRVVDRSGGERCLSVHSPAR